MYLKTFLFCFLFLNCLLLATSNKPASSTTPAPKGASTKATTAASTGSEGANGNETAPSGNSTHSKNVTKPILIPRILGGRPAQLGEYPYQLQMYFLGSHTCGGTLVISPTSGQQIGITAAHCIYKAKPEQFTIRAGSIIMDGDDAQELAVKQLIVHEEYNSDFVYDIGIIIFDGQFKLDDNVKPLALPKNEEVEIMKKYITVSGFGKILGTGELPKYLQVAQLKVIPNDKCQKFFNGLRLLPEHLCAGDLKGQTASCNGDSGGPAMAMDKQGNQFLAGAVSFGPTECSAKTPGVYTRISHYLDWIRKNSGASDVKFDEYDTREVDTEEYYVNGPPIPFEESFYMFKK